MIYPRFLARSIAFIGGYFWRPCSLCNKPFAGFEWGNDNGPLHDENGMGTCSRLECIKKAIPIREWKSLWRSMKTRSF